MKPLTQSQKQIMNAIEANTATIAQLEKTNNALASLLPERKRRTRKQVVKDPRETKKGNEHAG